VIIVTYIFAQKCIFNPTMAAAMLVTLFGLPSLSLWGARQTALFAANQLGQRQVSTAHTLGTALYGKDL
jgi:hypothetical protein